MQATEANLKNLVHDKNLKWIFVGGKGGVGKTTSSSSLAVLMSKFRENVLIISTDPAHNLSDCYDQKFGKLPTLINGFTNLYAMEVDPKIDADTIKLPKISGLPDDDSAVKSFISELVSAIPGIDEAMSFAELINSIEGKKYDVVIFDTAPTGHTLRLLNFPNLLEKGLEKLVTLKQKFSQFITPFSAIMGGELDVEATFETVFGNLEKMKETTERVNEQMKDKTKTTFVAVCIPEFLSMYETDRLIQELAKFKIDIHNIIINQVLFPDDNCKMCRSRSKMQKKYLDQILEMYDDFHVTIVPLQEEEVRGVEKLKTFCQLLLETRTPPTLPQEK
jgi:arsenite-transporting ATPase